jgi:hypothetical protein
MYKNDCYTDEDTQPYLVFLLLLQEQCAVVMRTEFISEFLWFNDPDSCTYRQSNVDLHLAYPTLPVLR